MSEGGASWRERYFNRVRPVLGELFFERRVAVWGLARNYLVAEALARTGLRQQVWLDDGVVADGDAQTRSLGRSGAGETRAQALATHCRAHNHFETDFALTELGRDLEALRGALPCDVLVAEIDDDAADVARAAVARETPLVMSLVPRSASLGCLQLVWRPGSAVDADALVALAGELAQVPRLDAGDPESAAQHHVEQLEAASLSLSLSRWLLAPQRPARPELEAALAAGRGVIARGQPSWPWSVRFLRPGHRGLRALLAEARPRLTLPPALLARERLLVLGLGTASLFTAEAATVARAMLLLDCKDVSPENPVRQVFSTRHIGAPKGRALSEILRARVDPDDALAWQEHPDEALGLTWLRAAGGEDTSPSGGAGAGPWALREVGFGELRLRRRDRASMARFDAMLDAFAPTLAIVGMGQSKNDNFTAAEALRARGIRHITPTAFPGVSHFKHILTDGERGPCYDCLQGHLAVDGGAGPTMARAEREMYYGGTQPATLAETLPSAHSLLRLARDLALPPAARPAYLTAQLAEERCCFVGANRVERVGAGSDGAGDGGAEGDNDEGAQWLYGVDEPFKMVTYGMDDLVGSRAEERCPSCGRVNRMRVVT